MIGEQEIGHYRDHGYIVVPRLLDAAHVEALRARTDFYLESARDKPASDAVHDLEDSHRPEAPRVRRIKDPCSLDGLFHATARHPAILAVVAALLGPDLRYHHSKINIKAAGYGSAVEWHQDWAFYPHTNDSVLEVGIAIDDCDADNGPMLVLPGSHQGPVFDHHVDGRFCGAIDPGSIRARRQQRCRAAGAGRQHYAPPCADGPWLGHQPLAAAAPAVPDRLRRGRCLAATENGDFDRFRAALVAGRDTLAPRLEPVPVRLPYPRAAHQGSIYENQRELKNPYFPKLKAT